MAEPHGLKNLDLNESAVSMKLLVIGGTQFVGHHLVQAACARGDQVTVFNRGQTPAKLPAAVQVLRGDRKQDLSALAAGHWDAVVDCCGYLPRDVAAMAELLQTRVGRYLFVSSVSVYASFGLPNREGSALGRIEDEDTEVIDGRTYGPLKALCEQAVQRQFGPRALVVRPGLVVGPHDPTQRFTWWPARVARAAADGLPMLAPAPADAALQFIDARDLAGFMLRLLDGGREGVFNAIAPPGFTSFGRLLEVCADAVGCRPEVVWADAQALQGLEVRPWLDLPLWIPAVAEQAAFMASEVGPALAAGLSIRPLEQTVADTLTWYRTLSPGQQAFAKAGLDGAREAGLLAALALA